MNDTEKIALITEIIGDFWEYSTSEERKSGAEAIVTAINSVVEFGENV